MKIFSLKIVYDLIKYGTDGHCLGENNEESAKKKQILDKFGMALLIVYAILWNIELKDTKTLFEDLDDLRANKAIVNFVYGGRHEKISNSSLFFIAQ